MSDDELTPLLFEYRETVGGGKPIIPLRLTAAYPVIVGATLAPSLPRTVVSPRWGEAAGLSPGGTVVAQVQKSLAPDAERWGPQWPLRPIHATELDEASEAYGEAEDVDWRALDVCLLGHDFLCNFVVVLDGVRGRLIMLDANDPLAA